jgi:hypothetical protein
MTRFAFILALLVPIAVTATPILASICDEDGEFDPSRSAVEQMVAAAKSLEITENEITSAILDGRFTPMPKDMLRTVIELDTRECADIKAEIVAKGWQWSSPDQVQCDNYKRSNGAALWAERFGQFDDDEVIFRLAQRENKSRDYPWVEKETKLEDVRSQPLVQVEMRKIRDRSYVMSFMCLSDANWPGGPWDFAGHYENLRDRYERSNGILSPEVGNSGPNLTEADERGYIYPSKRDIKDMLERRIKSMFAVTDALAFKCENYRSTGSHSDAMMCAFSGFGALSSDNLQIEAGTVSIRECHLITADLHGDLARCYYSAPVEIAADGLIGKYAGLLNVVSFLGSGTWGDFRRTNQGWELVRGWQTCTQTEEKSYCESVYWVRE